MTQDSNFEKAEVGWKDSVVMICSRCGKQFSDILEQESPERIKVELKSRTKEEFGKSVRVITTSCLNICPKGKIAITVASAKGNKENEGGVAFNAYAVDPSISGDDLFFKLHLK